MLESIDLAIHPPRGVLREGAPQHLCLFGDLFEAAWLFLDPCGFS